MDARWLVALYPASWRARYEEEFRALLEAEPATPSLVIDVIRGALEAHATPLPAGGTDMRSRTPAVASLLAVLLVLPALTFLAAALVRLLQPTVHEPARSADAIFAAFASLPNGWYWVVLGVAPVIALVLSLLAAWRRLAADQAARDDLAAFAVGVRRVARQPALVAAAFAFVASAAVLAFVIDHWIAG